LPPRSLGALRELAAWREQRAEATDTPPFKVLSNDALLHLAEKLPRAPGDLRGIPGVLPRLAGRATELLAAVSRAADLREEELPVLARTPRPVVPDAVLRRVDRLKAWRTRKAAELQVDVSVVLPQRLIDRLAEAEPRDADTLAAIEGLRRWRVAAFGPDLLKALRP
jgi:ribonuclease D